MSAQDLPHDMFDSKNRPNSIVVIRASALGCFWSLVLCYNASRILACRPNKVLFGECCRNPESQVQSPDVKLSNAVASPFASSCDPATCFTGQRPSERLTSEILSCLPKGGPRTPFRDSCSSLQL
jgi:hypothetical protein